ncbi:MAG: substrate-binding periplasmic protein [Rhodospirillaceae bacterium]
MVGLGSASAQASDSLRILTEILPPYQFQDEAQADPVLKGISIEIVQAIQERVGDETPHEVLPWSRALKLVKKNPNTFLFSTARTPEREEQFKWIGPLAPLEMVFFIKKGSGVEITSMDQAKTIDRIGVTKNVATHEILTEMGFENLDVMQSGSDDKNISRLVKGRIDTWPTAYYAGIYSARLYGELDQIEVVPNVTILSGSLYIAVNKETPDALVQKWQDALDALRAEGVVEAITARYDR